MEILVFFGLIASGKSTLAEAFARRQGVLYLNTDRVRKELAGIAVTERRPDEHGRGIYSREYTEKTYQAMLDAAAGELRQGKSVVLDGSYSSRKERARVLECGNRNGAKVCFILCHCSEEETRHRLELRARDPLAVSDGRWDIYLKQKETFEHPDELASSQLLILDTEAELDKLLSTITSWVEESALIPKP
ncbi:MAG: AAA family ATPase [Desulfobulbaceae bacterium]|nr:AAA family ATPase [Desulfobulbaceae bacterium]